MIANQSLFEELSDPIKEKFQCPNHVNITRIYEIFSLISMLGDFQRAEEEYQKLVLQNQSYLNCKNCGLCLDYYSNRKQHKELMKNMHQLLYSVD
jgi:predicted aldo/keto reductase-like oxidoreductase